MLIGFNNDVYYLGKVFHIQTEDHGEDDPKIETQLFHSGAILDTVITSYQEILDEYDGQEAEERIRAQMKGSHKSLYKKLFAGEYDKFAGLDPLEEAGEEVEAEPEDFTPSQERVPAAAAKVEEDGEDAIMQFQKKKAKNHVSLDQLKNQLSNLDESESEASEADDIPNTEVIDPADAGLDVASTGETSAVAPGPPDRRPAPVVDYPETGADAWDGCQPPADDLSLTGLVEEFLGL